MSHRKQLSNTACFKHVRLIIDSEEFSDESFIPKPGPLPFDRRGIPGLDKVLAWKPCRQTTTLEDSMNKLSVLKSVSDICWTDTESTCDVSDNSEECLCSAESPCDACTKRIFNALWTAMVEDKNIQTHQQAPKSLHREPLPIAWESLRETTNMVIEWCAMRFDDPLLNVSLFVVVFVMMLFEKYDTRVLGIRETNENIDWLSKAFRTVLTTYQYTDCADIHLKPFYSGEWEVTYKTSESESLMELYSIALISLGIINGVNHICSESTMKLIPLLQKSLHLRAIANTALKLSSSGFCKCLADVSRFAAVLIFSIFDYHESKQNSALQFDVTNSIINRSVRLDGKFDIYLHNVRLTLPPDFNCGNSMLLDAILETTLENGVEANATRRNTTDSSDKATQGYLYKKLAKYCDPMRLLYEDLCQQVCDKFIMHNNKFWKRE